MSAAIVEFMEELATDVAKQRAFRQDPEQYLAHTQLSQQQRQAVLSGQARPIRSMMAEHSATQEQMEPAIVMRTELA
ncbi:hypothetical protein [Streptomyces smyrnaeus]|uniref:hypothetical protein n=1 Tax=Streptomyces smyrnaeus TaxID=1387713 RepID=UPI001FD73E85|nr:hypothetical protein [Streptomyces smyrnaeus]